MRFRDKVIRAAASPYVLAAVSLFIFACAWLMPPSLYGHYLSEPDYMFCDPLLLLFFLLCGGAFVSGVFAMDTTFPSQMSAREERYAAISPAWLLAFPLLTGTVLALIACLFLIRDNPQLLILLFAAQGSELKLEGAMQLNGLVVQISAFLMGVVWWAMWRRGELRLSKSGKRGVSLAIFCAFLALVICSALLVKRGEVMVVVSGMVIVSVLVRQRDGKLTSAFVWRVIFIACVAVIVIFAGFAVIRGGKTLDYMVGAFAGYTISSYNRMAAMLAGILHYPFAGRGLYISAFASFNQTFNDLTHLSRIMGWPSFDAVWRSEFDAVSTAGLDGNLIWAGTFGYIFEDFGWFSPLVLFAYGLITGWCWRSLKLGRIAGVVFYPWCAYCILFWFGTNYMLDSKAVDLVLIVLFLATYESVLLRRKSRQSDRPSAHSGPRHVISDGLSETGD